MLLMTNLLEQKLCIKQQIADVVSAAVKEYID